MDIVLPECIIMRGMPGSGKSTWIAENCHPDTTTIVSADHFFLDDKGNYRFNRNLLRQAHDECLLNFMKAVELCAERIVVDNTNCNSWEIAVYSRIAQVHGYNVQIIQLDCDKETAIKRNIHNVPLDSLNAMAKSLTFDLPSRLTQGCSYRRIRTDGKA